MARSSSLIAKAFEKLATYQHLLIILLSLFLISTSPWIMMGRTLRSSASIWDYLHVYLGLLTGLLSITMFLANILKGKWRQYFPWLAGDFSQLKRDLVGLVKGKVPLAGGRGLFSFVEGLGMLLMLGVALTGVMWFFLQGSSDALTWRSYHIWFAKGFIGFIVVHVIFACLHLLDFIRN
ncbi:cytochrome b/b6 domain-containing protein [Shewanella sp. UCD-KL12]|uniref:cytochrome b/b6 domain-containing protein n=1 Tax=Shewanella sp. UCD-KL12 TaxID=1917163 RepID=UPI000970E9A6|nr:cytochrome b/b6 domain-containing protein [Shewanella sp. UCD-KL12]